MQLQNGKLDPNVVDEKAVRSCTCTGKKENGDPNKFVLMTRSAPDKNITIKRQPKAQKGIAFRGERKNGAPKDSGGISELATKMEIGDPKKN